MMTIVLAFLLSNGLLSIPGSLVFFTDGARDLRSAIQSVFHFIPFKIILDWYHLELMFGQTALPERLKKFCEKGETQTEKQGSASCWNKLRHFSRCANNRKALGLADFCAV